MINIQVHGVLSMKWVAKDEEDDALSPRTLNITTETGEQQITLFPARPKKEVVEDGIS